MSKMPPAFMSGKKGSSKAEMKMDKGAAKKGDQKAAKKNVDAAGKGARK